MSENDEPFLQEDAVQAMRVLIYQLAKGLVSNVGAVAVDLVWENDSAVLQLHVAQDDVCQVIGKQGRTVRSLRTILSAASMKYQQRFALDIVGASDQHHES